MSFAKCISEAKNGNLAAQRMLFEHLSRRSKILCLRYVKNHEDADEVMQDGFHKFFKSLPNYRYESEKSLYAFIKKIMLNECLMLLRKNETLVLVTETNIPEDAIAPEVFNKMDAMEIMRLIMRLPACYSTVFNLFAIESYNHKEIAEALQITEEASRARLVRARLLLQRMLTEKNENYETACK